MSERKADSHRTWWVGWIWAVPLAALGIVVWLAVREFSSSGPEVTVVFESAGGVEAGDTQVKYEDMTVGHVENVELGDDLRHVKMVLRFDSKFKDKLGPKTRFWIAGQDVSLTDISSLKAALLGPYIGVDPVPGPKTGTFMGLSEPPLVRTGDKGTSYVLHTDRAGSISRGSRLYYLGIPAGEIRDTRLAKDNRSIEAFVFIKAPFDQFVRTDTRFWDASAVRVSMRGGSPSLRLTSVSALVGGAVAFETADSSAPRAPPGSGFPLYEDKQSAQYGPGPFTRAYLVGFPESGGGLEPGAPVELAGARVGSVKDVRLTYDPESAELSTLAVIDMRSDRVGIEASGPSDTSKRMDSMLERLIAKGLRAQLESSPPLVGGRIIALDFVPNAKPDHLVFGGEWPRIPSAAGSGAGDLIDSANDVAAKINAMPLDQIADDIHETTRRLAAIMRSGEVRQSVASLNRSLENVEAMTGDARGKVSPILTQIQQATSDAREALADARALLAANGAVAGRPGSAAFPETLYQIARAARSLRELSDYLDRHPEALLEGKAARR